MPFTKPAKDFAIEEDLTIEDAAAELQLSPKTIRRLVKERLFTGNPDSEPTYKVIKGKRRLVIERWALERYKLISDHPLVRLFPS
jgi:hypothetical protein